jgi:prolyl-tRNA editing enzyme YbaK/EbsC (Cys-tRNA(Pro) deacylase)
MSADRADGMPRRAGSLERATAYLSEHGLADRVMVFDDRSTKTCELAAEAVGCELGQIVKSLLFMAEGQAVLALVAGDRRGDATAIAHEVGAQSAKFGNADEVRAATGYAIGGVSPFDLPPDLPVLVDDSLVRFETVWTAAGTPNSMVPLEYATLLELAGGRVARISR